MNDSYISKLISAFLGFSILISSSIFVFGILYEYENKKHNLGKEEILEEKKEDFSGKKAFVRSSNIIPNYYSTISLNEEFQPTGNLTDDLASYVAREIVKTNSNGLLNDEFGNKSINVPDVDKLSTEFADLVYKKNNLQKDPEEELKSILAKIKIDNSSDKDLTPYYNKLTTLLKNYLELEETIDFNSPNVSEILAMSEIGYQKSGELIEEL
ncbi:MAG: hypothetical protein RMK17_02690, partial [bacterium]|nr:hypothetical protein [bacterium]